MTLRGIALRALVMLAAVVLGGVVLPRACEGPVAAAWDRQPAPQVAPWIRALDAGRRDR